MVKRSGDSRSRRHEPIAKARGRANERKTGAVRALAKQPSASNSAKRATAADEKAAGGSRAKRTAAASAGKKASGATGAPKSGPDLDSIRQALDAALEEQGRIESTYQNLLEDSHSQLRKTIEEFTLERQKTSEALDATQADVAAKAAHAAQLNDELAQARAQADELAARAAAAQADAAGSAQALEAERRTLGEALEQARAEAAARAARAEELADELARVRVRADQVSDLEFALSEANALAAKERSNFLRLDDALAASRARVGELVAEVDLLRSRLSASQALGESYEARLGDAQAELFERRAETQDLQARLSRARQQVARLEDEQSELTRELAATHAENARALEDHKAEIADSARELEARLAELEQRLRGGSSKGDALAAQIESERTHIGGVNERASAAERGHAETAAALADLRRELDRRDLQLQALGKSRLVRLRRRFLALRRNMSGWRRRATARKQDNPLFDRGYYVATYPDVLESGLDPYAHYLEHGAREGRNPNPMFDTNFYLARNPDVVESGMNPLVHYFEHGAAELRDPHPLFSTHEYIERNPELTRTGQNPLAHYLAVTQSGR